MSLLHELFLEFANQNSHKAARMQRKSDLRQCNAGWQFLPIGRDQYPNRRKIAVTGANYLSVIVAANQVK
jgi:hypothetical protein